MSQPIWTIEMLGPLCARRDDLRIIHFHTRKAASLFAYLAYRPDRLFLRDELVDLLWPEDRLDAGRNSFRVALASLRRLLEPPSAPRNSFIRADHIHVHLNPTAYTTDKDQFERKIELSLRAKDDRERAILLMQASALYHGNLLIGLDDSWVIGERQRLIDMHVKALQRLIRLLVKLNDLQDALEYARRAVQADPFREESHRAVMQLYAALGRPAMAIEQYQELIELLAELEKKPSAATRELAAKLAGDAPLPEVKPTASAQTRRHSAPPPDSDQVHINPQAVSGEDYLPAPLMPIFGREEDLRQLCVLLAKHTKGEKGRGGEGEEKQGIGNREQKIQNPMPA